MTAPQNPSSGAQTTYSDVAQVIDDLPVILASARRARGLSVRAAAKEAGMSFSSFSRVEKGAGFTASVLTGLLRWLDQTGEGSTRSTRKWERYEASENGPSSGQAGDGSVA